jgi:hypothetical protein
LRGAFAKRRAALDFLFGLVAAQAIMFSRFGALGRVALNVSTSLARDWVLTLVSVVFGVFSILAALVLSCFCRFGLDDVPIGKEYHRKDVNTKYSLRSAMALAPIFSSFFSI